MTTEKHIAIRCKRCGCRFNAFFIWFQWCPLCMGQLEKKEIEEITGE